MADLPTIADRLNDTEISANAPLTETLMRRLGSNINFLLDFLGVTNGATSPSGDLQDLINAITLIYGHTMGLQYTSTGAGGGVTESIGTLTSQKFVNIVVFAAAPTLSLNYGPAGSGSRWFITKRANGTGARTMPANRRLGIGSDDYTVPDHQILANSFHSSNYTPPNQSGGSDGNIGTVNSDFRVPGSGGATTDEWMQVADLDYREASSWLLEAHFANTPQVTKFYVAYKLNLSSAGLVF